METRAASWFVLDHTAWNEAIADFFTSVGSHPADRWTPADLTVPPRMADVRLLHAFSQQTPVGERKSAVIPWADMVRREVANSLLKLLEEPPEYLTLLLLSESPRLLPTLRSRVRKENSERDATVVGGGEGSDESDFQQWKRILQSLDTTQPGDRQRAKDMLYLTPLLHETVRHGLVREAFSKENL